MINHYHLFIYLVFFIHFSYAINSNINNIDNTNANTNDIIHNHNDLIKRGGFYFGFNYFTPGTFNFFNPSTFDYYFTPFAPNYYFNTFEIYFNTFTPNYFNNFEIYYNEFNFNTFEEYYFNNFGSFNNYFEYYFSFETFNFGNFFFNTFEGYFNGFGYFSFGPFTFFDFFFFPFFDNFQFPYFNVFPYYFDIYFGFPFNYPFNDYFDFTFFDLFFPFFDYNSFFIFFDNNFFFNGYQFPFYFRPGFQNHGDPPVGYIAPPIQNYNFVIDFPDFFIPSNNNFDDFFDREVYYQPIIIIIDYYTPLFYYFDYYFNINIPPEVNICSSCDRGTLAVEFDDTPPTTASVDINSDSGQSYGTVLVPPALVQQSQASASGPVTLDVSYVAGDNLRNTDDNDDNEVGEVILDITLKDSQGNEITQLSEPLTICIGDTRNDDDLCLGFFNEQTLDWECQDKNPRRVGEKICGETDHLTSFAILLNGGGGGSSTEDYIIAYLSLGFVALAIIIIIIGVILIEIRYKYIEYKKQTKLHQLSSYQKSSSN